MKAILAIFMLLLVSTAMAHNKVVVIPMAGEDAKIKAFALISKESPPDSDYTFINADTLIDKITGLEWQRGDAQNTSQYDWNSAWDYCADLSLDSKDDWRLPSISELMSIVDYISPNTPINQTAFSAAQKTYYWSSSNEASNSAYVWLIFFGDGSVARQKKTSNNLVRCVRSNRTSGPLLQDNNDGTVTDLATALIWQQVDDGIKKDWATATSYCDGLSLGGEKDWRLPRVKELISIVDYRVHNPAVDVVKFPSTKSSHYWSASSNASNSGQAWLAIFTAGSTISYGVKTGEYYARCVRQGSAD